MSTNPVPATGPPPPLSPPRKQGGWKFDNRWLAPLLITAILVVGWLKFGITEDHPAPLLAKLTAGRVTTFSPTFVAILVAVLTEIVLSRLLAGRWPQLTSAYITGISVGILVRSTESWWPYALCSMMSIASKYALRYRGRHLWNPSNFGLSVLFFLAPAYAASLSQHWGNDPAPVIIIWCLGSLIVWRVGRLHISASYAAVFCLLAGVRSAVTGNAWLVEVAPVTGPMYQLFIFFMVTDPKTTTKRKWSQCAVAALVAVVEMIFRLNEELYAPFYALFIVGPVTNLIEIWWDSRQAAASRVKLAEGQTTDGLTAASAPKSAVSVSEAGTPAPAGEDHVVDPMGASGSCSR